MSSDPLDMEYPPLDAVGSRWWYWIAVYPIAMVLVVPLVVFAVVLFTVPLTVVESSTDAPAAAPTPSALLAVLAMAFAAVVLVVIMLGIVSSVLLPIALYMDARAVAKADLEWSPDPVLYGVLGLLPYFVTPLVGIVVAVYYLFRRHEVVGVP